MRLPESFLRLFADFWRALPEIADVPSDALEPCNAAALGFLL